MVELVFRMNNDRSAALRGKLLRMTKRKSCDLARFLCLIFLINILSIPFENSTTRLDALDKYLAIVSLEKTLEWHILTSQNVSK